MASYEYDEENQRIRMNILDSVYGASIEDYPVWMAMTIDKLMEIKKIVRIVLADTREHEYDFDESKMLLEIAVALERIMKEAINFKNVVIKGCENDAAPRYEFLQKFVTEMRYDPIDAYKQ